MAHALETTDGVVNFAFTGDRSAIWHKLGTPVSNDLTPAEMQKAAGVDWKVETVPSYVRIGGEEVATGDSALVRTSDNKILDNVSDAWVPVQNDEAFEFFSEFVNEGAMSMDTAGSIDGGRMVWALAKVNQQYELFSGDVIENYMLFSNPHKYGSAVVISQTSVRVVCNNTLTASLRQIENKGTGIRLNHRAQFDSSYVKQTLGQSSVAFEKFNEKMKVLAGKRFNVADIDSYLNAVFPQTNDEKSKEGKLSRVAETIKASIETQPGAEFGEGTFYALFNAITYNTDNVLGHKDDTRMKSAFYGVNATRKNTALKVALELAS